MIFHSWIFLFLIFFHHSVFANERSDAEEICIQETVNEPLSVKMKEEFENTKESIETVSESTREGEAIASKASPSQKYDLTEPYLSQLRKSAHRSAKKCRRGRCGDTKSKRLCYQAVREALRSSKIAPHYPRDRYAIRAHRKNTLLKNGFQNIIQKGFNAQNAPLGSVLVYSGGKRGYGHIEFKLNEDEYCSDFCSPFSASEWTTKRKLVGVYVFKKGTL